MLYDCSTILCSVISLLVYHGCFLLPVALKHLGDPDNAHHAFEQAIKLDPSDAAVALNYGVLLNSVGEQEQASVQLRRFQELAETGSGLDQEVCSKSLGCDSCVLKT
jgi:tetratricopeptide (TPR) repeat protein